MYLNVVRIDVFDGLAGDLWPVVVHPQQVEEVFLVVSEAWPENEYLCLLDGGRALVLQVVHMDNLLAQLVLNEILQKQGSVGKLAIATFGHPATGISYILVTKIVRLIFFFTILQKK